MSNGAALQFPTLVATLLIGLACAGDDQAIARTISPEVAALRLDAVLLYVEDPAITIDVHTTSLNGFQLILLDGTSGFVAEGDEIPGLRDASAHLEEGDEVGFCSTLAVVLRNSLVNRVMNTEALDAITVPSPGHHDPEKLFLRGSGELRIMGNVRSVDPDVRDVESDVVSELWLDSALELIDIVYGLGQTCVDAARAEAS